jgi:excisionase family DNA binding protein
MSNQPVTVGEAARILRVSEDTVRRLESKGTLRAARTGSGVRIFDRGEVERVATTRARDGARSGG